MRTNVSLGVALVLLCASVGCEKESGLPSKTSGALRADERALLADLPEGNVALFGGNYLRLQDFFQNSAFAKLMGNLEEIQPGMKAWTQCFTSTGAKSLTMLGGLTYGRNGLTMRYVMKGFGVEQVEACAKTANFATTVDPDRKYVAVEMASALGPMTVGYLVLADGALLTMQAMPLPPSTQLPPSTGRPDLEALVAEAARGNATADAGLVAELARIDRSRAIWFVGDAAGTPIADKVGLLRGWIDLDGGIAFDVSLQFTDPSVADQIAQALPEAKRQAGSLGGDVGAVVKALKFERKGDRLRFNLKISNRQLDAIMAQLGPMMGGVR